MAEHIACPVAPGALHINMPGDVFTLEERRDRPGACHHQSATPKQELLWIPFTGPEASAEDAEANPCRA